VRSPARFWDRLEPLARAVFQASGFQPCETANFKLAGLAELVFPKLKFWESLNYQGGNNYDLRTTIFYVLYALFCRFFRL
jgi:hypothetical protein